MAQRRLSFKWREYLPIYRRGVVLADKYYRVGGLSLSHESRGIDENCKG